MLIRGKIAINLLASVVFKTKKEWCVEVLNQWLTLVVSSHTDILVQLCICNAGGLLIKVGHLLKGVHLHMITVLFMFSAGCQQHQIPQGCL